MKTNLIAGIVIVLILGSIVFISLPTKSAPSPSPSPQAPVVIVTAPPEPTYLYQISGGKLVSGGQVLNLTQNQVVALKFETDAPYKIHLHGYDQMIDIIPQGENIMKINLDKAGRFEFEIEETSEVVGVIEVYPQ